MIAYLRGELAAVYEGRAVVDVNGLGFQVFISSRDAADLPPVGEEVRIHTYLSVREDAMQLFGFLSQDDLNVFRLMIGVSGVGPKVAQGILGSMSANDIRFAVFSDDVKAISNAPGVGKKTAQKLILELKDKLKLEDALEGLADSADTGGGAAAASSSSSAAQSEMTSEAVQALTALGYSNSEALRAVRKVKLEDGIQTQDILKLALKYIGS